MSVSNDFGDKKQSSSIPHFEQAVQISERDALKTEIAGLADAQARKTCEIRFAYAEESTRQMHAYYAFRETRYVDAHLKLEPNHALTLGSDERSYADRVRALRSAFAQSPAATTLKAAIATREAALWNHVDQALKRTQAALARDQNPAPDPSLRRRFHRARDR